MDQVIGILYKIMYSWVEETNQLKGQAAGQSMSASTFFISSISNFIPHNYGDKLEA